MQKVADQLLPLRCHDRLGMELHAVTRKFFVLIAITTSETSAASMDPARESIVCFYRHHQRMVARHVERQGAPFEHSPPAINVRDFFP